MRNVNPALRAGLKPVARWRGLSANQTSRKSKRAARRPPFRINDNLDCGNVLGLPALWSLHQVELNGLTLLQAPEARSLNRRVVNENVFTILTADEPISLGVVEPFHCSLFHS